MGQRFLAISPRRSDHLGNRHGKACHIAVGAWRWPSYLFAVAAHSGAIVLATGASALIAYQS